MEVGISSRQRIVLGGLLPEWPEGKPSKVAFYTRFPTRVVISGRARSHRFRRKMALIFAEEADSDEDLFDRSRDFLLVRRVVALSTADSLASRKSLRGIDSAPQGPAVNPASFKHCLN